MSKKVADIIVETLQSAGVKHCYGVVGEPAIGMALYPSRAVLYGRGGDVWEW